MREWSELFVTGRNAPPSPLEDGDEGERKRGFFRRLRQNMTKTRQALGAELQATMFERLDDEAFERLEEALIYADVGAPTTASIVERLENEAGSGALETGEDLTRRLRELLAETARVEDDTIDLRHSPAVILVVGVNGTGKTTSIGKIAWHLQHELGLSVLLGAGDTFRAAAVEQLATWAERAGADIVRPQAQGQDPASVAFQTVQKAMNDGIDIVIIDTAGRLQTKSGLMDELTKIRRVVEKQTPIAEVLLVLDATTGQNGLAQAEAFLEHAGVTGLVITKLDGTAKGGFVLAVQEKTGIPIKLVGQGEGINDLTGFTPHVFAQKLVG